VSAALKQKALTPTPFQSAERARLGHAIAAEADGRARRVALEQAARAADADVLKAIQAVEAAEAALVEAGPAAVRHVVDKALGKSDAPPMTVAQARARVIQCQDYLDECRQIRSGLKNELDKGDNGVAALRLTDAARAVVRVEMRERAIALADEVTRLQRELVAKGSALQWLAGVLIRPDRGEDDPVRRAADRMESAPTAWMLGTVRGYASFAAPTGGNAWAAAFEQLLRDANAALPED
jgi:hypothetical protein